MPSNFKKDSLNSSHSDLFSKKINIFDISRINQSPTTSESALTPSPSKEDTSIPSTKLPKLKKLESLKSSEEESPSKPTNDAKPHKPASSIPSLKVVDPPPIQDSFLYDSLQDSQDHELSKCIYSRSSSYQPPSSQDLYLCKLDLSPWKHQYKEDTSSSQYIQMMDSEDYRYKAKTLCMLYYFLFTLRFEYVALTFTNSALFLFLHLHTYFFSSYRKLFFCCWFL